MFHLPPCQTSNALGLYVLDFFLLVRTITTITLRPTLQKRQSTKYVFTHHNLHITTYNKTYIMLLTEKKKLKLTASGATLGYIDRHYVLDAQISLE